jgi:hypothetical protein
MIDSVNVKYLFKNNFRNIKTIYNQMRTEKSLQAVLGISNMAVSFSIDGFKRCGLMKKLYNVVLYENNEKVVKDEIMDYAIMKTSQLLKCE